MPIKKSLKKYAPAKNAPFARKEIRLLPEQLQKLSKAAKRHHIPLSRFIPSAAMAYCDEVFLCPDSQQIREVVHSCRDVSNALYHVAEKQKGFKDEDLRDTTDMLAVLEHSLVHILHHPPRLSEVLKQALRDPKLRNWLRTQTAALHVAAA